MPVLSTLRDLGRGHTPPRFTAGSSQPFSADPFLVPANEDYPIISKEMRGNCVGPMKPDKFFAQYMNIGPNSKPMPAFRASGRSKKELIKNLQNLSKSRAPENTFIKVIRDAGLCDTLHFVNTTNTGDTTVRAQRKPDISTQVKSGPGEAAPRTVQWRNQELPIERKPDSDDPFHDDAVEGRPRSEQRFYRTTSGDAEHALGQITSYSVALRESQHRSHCFSVLWLDSGMRFIRWDRAGAVVTKRINFEKDSNLIAEFFHRYNYLPSTARGHDPSVTQPSKNDRDTAWDALTEAWGKSPAPQREFLVQLEVLNESNDGEASSYVVGSPRWPAMSPCGRATQGYLAYGLKEKAVVYLKDTWRMDIPGFQKEGATYKVLHDNEVPHIPTVLCAGDVPSQATRTQDCTSESSCFGVDEMHRLQHYRLVLKEVGRDLSTFDNPKTLVTALYHVLLAHEKALDTAGILHRDISGGNILLYEGGGLLIDWDLARHVDSSNMPPPSESRQSWRTGTWQFIAARILKDLGVVHERKDDLESIIHVLTYFSFRYLKSAFTPEKLEKEMKEVYDQREEAMGIYTGGSGKKFFFLGEKLTASDVAKSFSGCPSLAKLINSLRNRFAPLYRTPLEAAEEDSSEQDRLTRKKEMEIQETVRQNALESLKTSRSIIETFEYHLKTGEWSSEGAVDRLPRVSETKVARKRRRESEILNGGNNKRFKSGTYEDS